MLNVSRRMRVVWVGWWLLAFLSSACAAETQKVELKTEADTRYLPYSVEIVDAIGEECSQIPVLHSRRVFSPKTPTTRLGFLTYVKNPCCNTDGNSNLLLSAYPGGMILAEAPVRDLAVSDIAVATDSTDRDTSVIGTGFWHDSAYVFKWSPGAGALQRFFVATGIDRSGNGSWGGVFPHILTADCDLDGHVELLFYLNPERDLAPRLLVCVQGSPFRIKWVLPIASMVQWASPCRDSLGAGILLSTHNPGQQARDSLFDDSFAYLVRVDIRGKVLFSRVVSHYPYGTCLARSKQENIFYLLHGVPLGIDTGIAGGLVLKSLVSKVNAHGIVIHQYEDSTPGGGIWTGDWEGDGVEDIYLKLRSSAIQVLDTSLIPKMTITLGPSLAYISVISGFDAGKDAFVLHEGSGQIGLYSEKLQKLAELPYAAYLEVLERGSRGEVRAVVGAAGNKSFIAEITRRDFWTYIAIFYRSNQVYVLATLFGALSALLVSNYYRRRTKQDLTIINSQKAELESTHQALKQAQATIIAQERYRQAKDIAGGFAHEIRNALFPADSSLTKLRTLGKLSEASPEKIDALHESIRSAVVRAVDITRQITQYTKLDSEYYPEPVNLQQVVASALKANRVRIEDSNVNVKTTGDAAISVAANVKQLYSVFNNLLLNSLDALTNRTNPAIMITWSAAQGLVSVSFSDNGTGISDATQKRVFDTFYSTKPNSGTGLGLAVAKRIVELYGGTITVSSVEDTGTKFEICLKQAGQ